MEYKDIEKVNSEIQMIDLKGKAYAMVPERVTAFRKLYPEGFIKTEIVTATEMNALMKSAVGYYKEDGSAVILGTGYAQETKGKGIVNGTSYIENCETSAVGRALGFMSLGLNGGGICSAEELVNAVVAKKQIEEDFQKEKKQIEETKLAELDAQEKEFKRPKKGAAAAKVETVDELPW